jgi:hypothetical protein
MILSLVVAILGMFACIQTPVYGEDEVILNDVSITILCRYEKRVFEISRAAAEHEGDPDIETPTEKIYKEQLFNQRAQEFKEETGKDFDSTWGEWNIYVISRTNPCRNTE